MGKFRRQRADDAMRKTLSSSQSLDESLLREAAAKAFVPLSSPLTGANAVPVTSTPTHSNVPPVSVDSEDGPLTENMGARPGDFQ